MTHLATPLTTSATAPEVAAVADSMVGLLRLVGKARARMLAAAATDMEWSAHLLLKQIHIDGPMRAASLADALRSDPSTVSRQVSVLAKDGLLERRPDPDDGRASLLALTPKAEALLAEHDQVRLERFAEMLDGWTETELQTFATMLTRFTADYESAHHSWFDAADRPAGSSN